ncbi:hypothetical protein AaE_004645 [Aphanomyces astaci]|uniref:Uncharacterized protein n=1 Tax=Aphanomyces astaci TaxID=112090 RepID=A0A6A5AHZ0_APHAT|nr:hypothetical protein AaE_004645 [Aphanomyces astaci]
MESLQASLAGVDTVTLHAVFPTFAKPLFKRFNDPVEKVRDSSVRLSIRFVAGYPDLLPILPYLMPAIANRIGSTWDYDEKLNIFVQDAVLLAAHNRGRLFVPEADVQRIKPREPSEEVRLLFVELLQTLLATTFDQNASSLLNAYVYDIIRVLVYGLHDSFPSVVIKTCETLVLLSLNLVSVVKHFAVALVRATKHLLEHRLAKVRVAAMLCIRTLVMVPNVDKCKGAGTEAIMDLVAHQDDSVIPVAAFYTAEIKVNLFAKLDQDGNVLVRQTFFDTITIWLLQLPDRYDYESRLMPYLLRYYLFLLNFATLHHAVADDCPSISSNAIDTIDILGKRHAAEHPDEVIERTQYAVDGGLFCNFTKPYPAPFSGRPSLGTRLYIRGRCRRFINTLLRELNHWQGPTRVHASRLLVCLLVYCEDTITVDLHLIVPHLIQCWDDVVIRTSLGQVADCCGRFTQPASYISLFLPYIRGDTPSLKIVPAMQVLHAMLGGMSGVNRTNLLAQLPLLTEALTMRFLLNSTSVQSALSELVHGIVCHLQGLSNLGCDPSFESHGRLVSKSLLFERLLRILLTLPATLPLVQATMTGLQTVAGVPNLYDTYFEATWDHLRAEYPVEAWVDWSPTCYEHKMLAAVLVRGVSARCAQRHALQINDLLLAIWTAPCDGDLVAKQEQRRDSIAIVILDVAAKTKDTDELASLRMNATEWLNQRSSPSVSSMACHTLHNACQG